MQLLDDAENLIHQNRGQAHGGLIQHQELGPAHQRPRHGQHLLLAAGEGAGNLLFPLPEAGKALEHFLDRAGDFLLGPAVGAHFQVFPDGHLLEDPAALRAEAEPLIDHPGSARSAHGHAVQGNGALPGPEQAGDGVEGRGFPGAVGTDQGHDFPLMHLQGDSLDGVNRAVVHMQIPHLQQRKLFLCLAHASASFRLPR